MKVWAYFYIWVEMKKKLNIHDVESGDERNIFKIWIKHIRIFISRFTMWVHILNRDDVIQLCDINTM